MDRIKLFTGHYIDKKYFDDTLTDLLKETWERKEISELPYDHINCLLTMETISPKTEDYYYESNNNNIITVKAYEHYIKQAVN
jgi:hypothetical protein